MAAAQIAVAQDKYRQKDRWKLFGATALTYGIALFIISCNNYFANEIGHAPIDLKHSSLADNVYATTLLDIIGSTPLACLTRIAVIALVVQGVNYLTMDTEAVDLERYRPYVFWRATFRFLSSCMPFLANKATDETPKTSLTEYERITVRYFVVKLIFLPMMISFFYGNFQRLINLIGPYTLPHGLNNPFYIEHLYLTAFTTIMVADIAWFALGCSIETQRFSPIKMVDPYAFGWLVTLACYPPLNNITGQFLPGGPPEFPTVAHGYSAIVYASIGMFLYTLYVIADFSFGLKTGNLTYRGLVDKGPYKLVRHPMYSFKNMAWLIFTIPALNIHIARYAIPHMAQSIPFLSINCFLLFSMMGTIIVYALRALTEERYLLTFPEYRDYCKRVRYRFIPWVI